ncbi:hypothetical protein CS542_02665 [Pedobacter sp. IW39]|nr:hypothetical protein CS542_02665 [Pedobacter sp. IW39]
MERSKQPAIPKLSTYNAQLRINAVPVQMRCSHSYTSIKGRNEGFLNFFGQLKSVQHPANSALVAATTSIFI